MHWILITSLIFLALQFHMVEATYRVKEARKQLYSENGRQPDNEEVAEAAGLSMKRLNAVLLAPKAPRSLDQKIGINQNLKPSVRPFSNLSITPSFYAIFIFCDHYCALLCFIF